jgi:hypothetical protein
MHQPTLSGVYVRGNGIPKRAKAYPTPRIDNTAQAKKNEKAGCISRDFFRRRTEKVQLQPGKCPVRCQEVLGAFSAAGLPFRGGVGRGMYKKRTFCSVAEHMRDDDGERVNY